MAVKMVCVCVCVCVCCEMCVCVGIHLHSCLHEYSRKKYEYYVYH